MNWLTLTSENAIAFGLPIGLIQQQVLRHWISSHGLWMFLSVMSLGGAVFFLPVLIYGVIFNPVPTVVGSVMLICLGSILGYTQGAMLRSHLPEWREWWILQTVIAIAAVLLWSLTISFSAVVSVASVLSFAIPIVFLYAVLSGRILNKLRPALAA